MFSSHHTFPDKLGSVSLQRNIDSINQWSIANHKEFTVSFKNQPLLDPLTINNQPLEAAHITKTGTLGVYLSSDLKWTTHTDYMCSKASKRSYALRFLKRYGTQPRDLRSVYYYFVRPILQYASPVRPSLLPVFNKSSRTCTTSCAKDNLSFTDV